MPELQDRRFIRRRFLAQINPGKLPHYPRVVQRVVQRLVHTRIGQVGPVLHEVEAQHSLLPLGAASRTGQIRIISRQRLYQFQPRNDPLHLLQKLLFMGLLGVLFKAGQTALAHTVLPSLNTTSIFAKNRE